MDVVFEAKHRFGPKDTIRGAIRRYNTKVLSEAEMDKLYHLFNHINNEMVPRVGDIFVIPVIDDHSATFDAKENNTANLEIANEFDPLVFPSQMLVIMLQQYPHHYQMLANMWRTDNFDVYLARVVNQSTDYSQEIQDEIAEFITFYNKEYKDS